MKVYNVLGMMSGTSLDGVDLAFCEFTFDGKWKYLIKCAETIHYPNEWINCLSTLINTDALTLTQINADYGRYLGTLAKDFIDKNNISPDFISSHGHTIFHQPDKGFTLQIGEGSYISAITGLPVVFNFRVLDVALGGQGAPLVPIGDHLLFNEFDYCLNLGGIANISFENNGKRIAFDICPVNIVLNYLAAITGSKYDSNGTIAAKGQVVSSLLNHLNQLDYYKKNPPKSLGREWINHHFLPLIIKDLSTIENKLRTVAEHISNQIAQVVNSLPRGKLLVTGGGAKNVFLVKLLKSKISSEVIIPDVETIDFKEALIFAFLGVMRWRCEINTLASVTGASKDSCGGTIAGVQVKQK